MDKGGKKLFRIIEPYLYLLPALLLFCVFLFWPFGKTLYLSFTTTTPQGSVAFFSGLENYISIFTSSVFIESLIISFKYSIFTVASSITLGLILALIGNEKVFGVKVFRTFYAMPMAVSAAAASVIFMFIFHSSLGILNRVLGTNIGWLTDPKWALISVTIVTVWMNVGLNFIFLLAALQSVPMDLYECASIEGAGFFQKHWNVSLPCISPTLFFLLIINVINSLQAFAQIKMMTQGGPSNSTNVIVYQIYQEAFRNSRFGIACAQSVILFLILLVLTMLQFRLEKKVTY